MGGEARGRARQEEGIRCSSNTRGAGEASGAMCSASRRSASLWQTSLAPLAHAARLLSHLLAGATEVEAALQAISTEHERTVQVKFKLMLQSCSCPRCCAQALLPLPAGVRGGGATSSSSPPPLPQALLRLLQPQPAWVAAGRPACCRHTRPIQRGRLAGAPQTPGGNTVPVGQALLPPRPPHLAPAGRRSRSEPRPWRPLQARRLLRDQSAAQRGGRRAPAGAPCRNS